MVNGVMAGIIALFIGFMTKDLHLAVFVFYAQVISLQLTDLQNKP